MGRKAKEVGEIDWRCYQTKSASADDDDVQHMERARPPGNGWVASSN
jgi:hypothetical protein